MDKAIPCEDWPDMEELVQFYPDDQLLDTARKWGRESVQGLTSGQRKTVETGFLTMLNEALRRGLSLDGIYSEEDNNGKNLPARRR